MLRRYMKWVPAFVMAGLSVSFVGCAPQVMKDYDAFVKRPSPIIAGKPYVIDAPDRIQIVCPAAPEINHYSPVLRPDGYITVPLIGEHFAAGKTPTQLASELQEKILKYYDDVSVQVTVSNFASKNYYMAGETSAGPKPFTGRDTVLKAVLSAGLPDSSWPKHVLVIRPNENIQYVKRMTVDMDRMIKYGDLKYNIILEEGDIIYIPTHPLALFGKTIQNMLSPVNPALRAATTPGRITGTNYNPSGGGSSYNGNRGGQ